MLSTLRDSEKRFKELSSVYDNMRDQMNEEIRSLKVSGPEIWQGVRNLQISCCINNLNYNAFKESEKRFKERTMRDHINEVIRSLKIAEV